MSLSEMETRLTLLQARMVAACYRAGRDPSTVALLPVSKNVSVAHLRTAVALGLHRFAENKIQEVRDKAALWVDPPIEWVMIGHLQTNKAKDAVKWMSEVQSLDCLKLAQTLDRHLQREGRSLDVLIQVKTSDEPNKYGLKPAELPSFLQTIARHYDTLRVRGLMTLAVHSSDTVAIRACFRQLREWRDRLQALGIDHVDLTRLSMGMSGDFEIAIEEGATEVRIGSALFAGLTD